MSTGVLAGYPMVDIKVALIDGSFHEVDSSDMAFKIAGSLAFKNAAQKAQPGASGADHGRRGGHARPSSWATSWATSTPGAATSTAWSRAATTQVINATVPLSTMFGYATDLRSATQGRATYTMQFMHYAEVPASIAAEIVAKVRGWLDERREAFALVSGRSCILHAFGAAVGRTAS